MHTFLQDVRVLDFSRYLPGPYATHILTEMGAEVINIEDPKGGNPMRMLPPIVTGRAGPSRRFRPAWPPWESRT